MLNKLDSLKKYFFIALFQKGAIFISICLLLTGCVQRKDIEPQVETKGYEIPVDEIQARLTDVVFPVDAVMKQGSTVQAERGMQWLITCTTQQSMTALQELFHEEMEQLGWREVVNFEAGHPSHVLLFEKPRKVCVIIIEQAGRTIKMRYHIAYV